MGDVGRRKRGRAALLAYTSGAFALAFLFMAFTAWSRFTTIGIDSDKADGPFVFYSYYRIRWPGDGSFRVVGGAFRYGHTPGKAMEPFDLGGRFFKPPPSKEPPQSLWNQMGFWFYAGKWDDERTKTDLSAPKPWEAWIGVPCLLPVVLFAWFPLSYWRRQKQNQVKEKSRADN